MTFAAFQSTALALVLALVTGCSTERPWINQPLAAADDARATLPMNAQGSGSEPVLVVVALSGGGARAAAFGLGVLREMKETQYVVDGRKVDLMQDVQLISGVSGGSILAAYYAAFGDETFTKFEKDVLLIDMQSELVKYVLAPTNLYRLTSPWLGRSNLNDESLRKIYRGTTFGDLMARGSKPTLLVTATDLTTGAPFEFTPDQFALICSDLRSVPLSVAVAASSAVPLLLSPVTIHNFAGTCSESSQFASLKADNDSTQARMLTAAIAGYLDSTERPYLHLVDGGITDNLGVRSLLDRSIAIGSLDKLLRRSSAPGSVRKIVLISVNSEREMSERLDKSDRVPTLGQVVDALTYGAGARMSQETVAMMKEVAQRWAREVSAIRGQEDSPLAADAEVHVISVSLREIAEATHQGHLLHVPTSFTILPQQVRELQTAGRTALRNSPEFQQLRRSLGLPDRVP